MVIADVLAVWDEYQAQSWATLIQECATTVARQNKSFVSSRGLREKLLLVATEAAGPQLVQLHSVRVADDMLQIQYWGVGLKLPAGVGIEAVAALLRSRQIL